MDQSLKAEKDLIRVPLYTADSNRIYQAGSEDWIQPDSILVNCWAKQTTPNPDWVVTKRPGVSYSASLESSFSNPTTLLPLDIIGITKTTFQVFVAAIADTTSQAIKIIAWNNTGSSIVIIGSIATWGISTMKAHLTEISISGTCGIAVNIENSGATLSTAYYAMTTAGAFTAGSLINISDAQYPGNIAGECAVGPFVQLNEHVFILGTSGIVYNSDQASISSWNALGVQPSSIEPDKGVALAKYKQHLVAFGLNSMEFFEDAGLAPPGGPLQRTEQAFIKFGTIDSHSIVSINDTLWWLAYGASGERGLYKMEQYTPVKVSPDWVETYLYPINFKLRLGVIYLGGLKHITITGLPVNTTNYVKPLLPDSATYTPAGSATETYPITAYDLTSATLCYAIEGNSWWCWSDENISNVAILSASGFGSGVVNSTQCVLKFSGAYTTAGSQGPAIYNINEGLQTSTQFTDDAAGGGDSLAVCVIIQLPPIEFQNERRKAVSKVKLIADAMVKYDNDTSTGNQLYLLYNRLDGQGTIFSRAKEIPSTNHRYYWNNLGMTRKLYLALVCKTAMPFRAKAFELEVTQGLG